MSWCALRATRVSDRLRELVRPSEERGGARSFRGAATLGEESPGFGMTAVVVRDLGEGEERRGDARPEPVGATQLERFLEATPGVGMAAGGLPGEGKVPDRVRSEQPAAVLVPGSVGRTEVGQRRGVVVSDDLPDDPDPEPRPADEQRIAGASRGGEGRLEMGQLAWVLPIATAEKAGMEDATALGLEAGLNPIELSACCPPSPGRAREQGLLVEKVRAEQRVVTGELDGLGPAALSAEPRHAIARGQRGSASARSSLHLTAARASVNALAARGTNLKSSSWSWPLMITSPPAASSGGGW